MKTHDGVGPEGPWQSTLPNRSELAQMAVAGMFPVDLWLVHLLDRIEGVRP